MVLVLHTHMPGTYQKKTSMQYQKRGHAVSFRLPDRMLHLQRQTWCVDYMKFLVELANDSVY